MSERTSYTTLYILIFLVIASLSGLGYITYLLLDRDEQIANLTEAQAKLTTKHNETMQSLLVASNTIAVLSEELNLTTEELEELEDDYRSERRRNKDFEDQIDDLSDTLSTLDKLSKTDEELLQKYSKVSFLNENYLPSDLDEIDDKYVQDNREPEFFHGDAMEFLEDLMAEAEDDDIDITIISAYRSFDEQNEIKGQFTQMYGTGANTFSADQGFSEHQLGTTVDFGTSEIGSAQATFTNTEAYEWLLDHAHKYGFTLSYPADNQFYIFEPWHWRFVGVDLARDLKRDEVHFYDWDQRKIDSYLIKIFD